MSGRQGAPDGEASDGLQQVLAKVGEALEGLARRLDALESAAITVAPTFVGLAERIDALEAAPSHAAALGGIVTRVDALEAAAAVEAVTRWVAHESPSASQRIAVVTPTRKHGRAAPGHRVRACADPRELGDAGGG